MIDEETVAGQIPADGEVPAHLRPPEVYTLVWAIERRFKTPGSGQVRTEEVTQVTVGRPKARHIEQVAAATDTNAAIFKMIPDLIGLDRQAFGELDVADLYAIAEIVKGFLPAGLFTGETS